MVLVYKTTGFEHLRMLKLLFRWTGRSGFSLIFRKMREPRRNRPTSDGRIIQGFSGQAIAGEWNQENDATNEYRICCSEVVDVLSKRLHNSDLVDKSKRDLEGVLFMVRCLLSDLARSHNRLSVPGIAAIHCVELQHSRSPND